MKILIIEDEEGIMQKNISYCKRYSSEFEIVGKASSIAEIREFFEINYDEPDLIIADIILGDGNVFEFFQKAEIDIPKIFCTSKDEYYLNALKTFGIEYLLKPYSYEDFSNALKKFYNLKRTIICNYSKYRIPEQEIDDSTNDKGLIFKTENAIGSVDKEKIKYIFVNEKEVYSISEGEIKHRLDYETLNEVIERLSSKIFFKVNKSEIVNLNYISSVEKLTREKFIIKLKETDRLFITSRKQTPKLRIILSF